MALSGSVATNHFSDGSVNETYMQYNWSATQSTSGNYSVVTWEIVAHRVNTNNYVYFHNFTRNVNGSSGSKGSTNYKNDEVIDSGSFTVYHNDNGTGSFSMSMSANVYYSSGGAISVSKTFTLDTIPRYTNLYISEGSKGSSYFYINWSTTDAIDTLQYSLNGGNWINASMNTNKSGYFYVSASPATTYSVKCRAKRADSQLWSESGSISIRTYQKTIPTLSVSSKTVNSITVTSSCNVTVSSTRYILRHYDGSWGAWQTSPTFTGLSPNSTYVIQVEKKATDSGEAGYTEIIVTTHDIAKINYYGNIYLGDTLTITYSNPSGAPIEAGVYDIYGQNAFAAYRKVSGNSYTFNFTDTELDALYKAMGKNNTLSVSVYLNTNNNQYRDFRDISVILNGNQKTAHIGKSGEIKRGKVFIDRKGIKRGVLWRGVNGTARRCI